MDQRYSISKEIAEIFPGKHAESKYQAIPAYFLQSLFETFLLAHEPQYRVFDTPFEVLFNSYYNAVGEQFPREHRGLLSRPSLANVFAYREYVDHAVADWLASGPIGGRKAPNVDVPLVVELGIQHEQQHQELILTDIKHLFSRNPLLPTFREGKHCEPLEQAADTKWLAQEFGWQSNRGNDRRTVMAALGRYGSGGRFLLIGHRRRSNLGNGRFDRTIAANIATGHVRQCKGNLLWG